MYSLAHLITLLYTATIATSLPTNQTNTSSAYIPYRNLDS